MIDAMPMPMEMGMMPQGPQEGLDLSVGAPVHNRLKEMVRRRFDVSSRVMSQRYDRWNEADALLRGYVDFTKKDRDNVKEHPYARDIIIPYSYAVQQIYLTYLMAVFTAKEPIFPIQGYGPEDSASAEAMEHVLSYQMDRADGSLMLYALFQDTLRYGVGACKALWETEQSTVIRRVPIPFPFSLFMGPEKEERVRVTGYEGSVLHPVDPFSLFPDPKTPLSQMMKYGEYIGHRVRRNFSYIRQKARDGVYLLENVEKIAKWTGQFDIGTESDQARRDEYLGVTVSDEPADDKDRGTVWLEELFTHLVPNDWGLGPSEDLEVWALTVANRETLIRAKASSYTHGKLPYVLSSFGFDPHAFFGQSLSELMNGLQTAITWLYNSHMQNVRKGLNIEGVYDPSVLETEDLRTPQPGKWIRLKPEYYGAPNAVSNAWKQLAFEDVTSRHFQDMSYHLDMIQRITAATDPQAGVETETRRTLGEIQNVLAQSGRRLQLTSSLLAAQAVRPLGRLMIAMTQQLLTEPKWVRVLGNASPALLAKAQGGLIQIGPADVQGQFDLRVQDGTVPPDPSRFAETWKEIFVAVTQNPMILPAFAQQGKQLRLDALFMKTVETMGVKNMEEFFEQMPPPPTVMPDQQVAQMAQAGNIAPIGSGGNGAPAGGVTPVGMQVR